MATSQGDRARRSEYRPGYEIVAGRILEYISDRGLLPGDRLPTEQQLCEVLDVSRSVVREAVKVLSAFGRISVRKGAGLFVADEQRFDSTPGLDFQPSNLDHMAMMFQYRLTVETEAARCAAERASPAEVMAVRNAAQRCVDAAAREDFASFRAADDEFHRSIGAAAHNMFISSAVDQVTQLKRQVLTIGLRGRASGSLGAAADEHVHIADAISAGEPQRAVEAMATHIQIARSQFQQTIKSRLQELVDAETEAGSEGL